MEPTYLIVVHRDLALFFEGTIEQADDTYGLRVGADESDLIGFVQRYNTAHPAREKLALYKRINTEG